MTVRAVVCLDDVAARCLVHALDELEVEFRKDYGVGVGLPDSLCQLRSMLTVSDSGRQGTTSFAVDTELAHDSADGSLPLLLSYRRVAAELSVSTRMVERLASAGVLPVVHVGSAPRVRRSDLEAFVAGLAPGSEKG